MIFFKIFFFLNIEIGFGILWIFLMKKIKFRPVQKSRRDGMERKGVHSLHIYLNATQYGATFEDIANLNSPS